VQKKFKKKSCKGGYSQEGKRPRLIRYLKILGKIFFNSFVIILVGLITKSSNKSPFKTPDQESKSFTVSAPANI
jgi:hypothetical protein